MSDSAFDEHAREYDGWFLKNRNVLQSEVLLLARFLQNPGQALSVGCGSGLFEKILSDAHGIDIHHGVEPASGGDRRQARHGGQGGHRRGAAI